MIVLWVLLAVVVLLALYVVLTYNGLVKLNVRVEEAWSDITVQLKRRYDLIPNLVSTVQGYAKHESSVFQNVTEARANALNAQGPAEVGKADPRLARLVMGLLPAGFVILIGGFITSSLYLELAIGGLIQQRESIRISST